MERADFIHLVRLSEHASAEDSAGYRRSVAGFAALGYGWVIGCALLGAAALGWVAWAATHGRFRGVYIWGAIAGAGLLWTSLRALWFTSEPPAGVKIGPEQAPALFDSLERIRRKIKGPPIHDVYLDADFNASIGQQPRWGLFGGARNHLTLGLPLLMAVDRQRLLAVLAHEYGHLRGDHGRFAAWIYRTRLSWARLDESLRHDEGVIGAATQGFLRWYFPRFVARTFALARQDEYEADRIAGKLLGRDVAAAALTEIAIKGDWLDQAFWPAHWRGAAAAAVPQGPYASMRDQLRLDPPGDFAQRSLRQALKRLSDVDDTHPVLRDRLEALEARPGLPAWSRRPAIEMLGDSAGKWIAHFDKQWCGENATAWKQHHAYLGRVRARIDALQATETGSTADEWVERADLMRRLTPDADVQALYERALALLPQHGGALRGLAEALAGRDPVRRMACLESLHQNSPAHRWWAARVAVEQLESDPGFDEAQLKRWRERRRQAEEAEERAWEEMTGTGFFEAVSRHDLSEFELGELQADLARFPAVARAWLVRKNLREFPWRRCYLLFVELPGLDDEDRYDLCRTLERWVALPGPALALWAGESPTLRDIERQATPAVYARG